MFQERLGGKADLAALETKAGKDDVARLQAAMQSKAPLDALAELRDELARLKSQLEAQRGVARVANVPSGPSSLPRGIDPTAGIDSDLRSQLRNKADRSEIQGLQDALAGLQAQLLGNSAIPQGLLAQTQTLAYHQQHRS